MHTRMRIIFTPSRVKPQWHELELDRSRDLYSKSTKPSRNFGLILWVARCAIQVPQTVTLPVDAVISECLLRCFSSWDAEIRACLACTIEKRLRCDWCSLELRAEAIKFRRELRWLPWENYMETVNEAISVLTSHSSSAQAQLVPGICQ